MSDARHQLWIALADLYLDTDTTSFVEPIARMIVQTGFTLAEAEAALRWDVRPALWGNVVQVAGRWDGWEPAWLIAHIERKRSSRLLRLLLGHDRLMPDPAIWQAIAAAVRQRQA